MKNTMIKKGLLTLIAGMLLALPASAEPQINEDFEGLAMISHPDGEVILVEKGTDAGIIPSGSICEVFEGVMELSTGPNDQVQGLCYGQMVDLRPSTRVTISAGESSVEVDVIQGAITVMDLEGVKSTYPEGAKYTCEDLASPLAPPVAAGDEIGTIFDTEDVPVDSRNIDIGDDPRTDPVSP